MARGNNNDEWIKCYQVPDISRQETPYKWRYASIHGFNHCIPKLFGPSMPKGKTEQDVYKEALEKRITWEQVLNYKPDDSLIL